MTSSDAGHSTPAGVPQAQSTSPAGATPAGSYPRLGHAPDYSWIAGRVTVTRIQGGCTFIATEDIPTQAPQAQPTGPIVGTAVAHDTSPPLRDITPVVGGSQQSGPVGPLFAPNGPGWDGAKVAKGDYVVLFGHIAGPGDSIEMCPGGTPYIADTMQLNR